MGGHTTMVPLFWLRALLASNDTCAAVARRDQLALSGLLDVRGRWDWGHMPTADEPWRYATLEWSFADTPYFWCALCSS
jgi:hypothetical protein